jgi:hypothetical protein
MLLRPRTSERVVTVPLNFLFLQSFGGDRLSASRFAGSSTKRDDIWCQSLDPGDVVKAQGFVNVDAQAHYGAQILQKILSANADRSALKRFDMFVAVSRHFARTLSRLTIYARRDTLSYKS